MNPPCQRIPVFPSAIALSLLLGVANATALTIARPGNMNAAPVATTAPVATSAPAPTDLTPTAPAASPTSPVGEDTREIRQPRHLTQPWFWAALAVGVATLLGAALAFWRWLRHGKFFVMLPYEIALQGLDEARRLLEPDHAREYCFEVSKVIRRFSESQFHLQAAQLTTEEFLRELVEGREIMLPPHRARLGDFLHHCGLARFAGSRCGRPDLEAIHDCAVEFVRQAGLGTSGADKDATLGTTTPTQNDPPSTNAPRTTSAWKQHLSIP